MMVKLDKLQFLVDMSSIDDLAYKKLTGYTTLYYKDFIIGTFYHGSTRKNRFAINALEDSEFEAYLNEIIGKTVLSDSEAFKVAWLDLGMEDEFEKLEDLTKELHRFEESGLRK
ncbi:hypothetical protein [Kurthia sibirica]|uniref:Uncharacterized protein n=1 Tax=Kurthia sibirica TaxID=202750 RepID=A0A2U3AJ71_9BACL|nr:hypothetical protein [Kurthia sibirica]PWI24599.1 hypothetical protein DEX24_12925 [Kurthia sibirica]GEK33555.1 hypothetical protein KSI01_10880 [Kurthia sibirica]